jgi:predicted DNA-binding transcriptional regulator AlpA
VQVLSLDQAAMRAGIVRRTLERLLAVGEGPATIQISRRRVGVAEADLEAWLNSRRRVPPGFKSGEAA